MKRTDAQNRALHKFLENLAQTLNNAGLDMKCVLKEDVDIPWTKDSAKEFLWRPIQRAMTGKESTTDMESVDPAEVHEVLMRHLGEKFEIPYVDWPSHDFNQ